MSSPESESSGLDFARPPPPNRLIVTVALGHFESSSEPFQSFLCCETLPYGPPPFFILEVRKGYYAQLSRTPLLISYTKYFNVMGRIAEV